MKCWNAQGKISFLAINAAGVQQDVRSAMNPISRLTGWSE
jgi:hypothetical protein